MEGHSANSLGDFKIHVDDILSILAAKALIFLNSNIFLSIFFTLPPCSEHVPTVSKPSSPISVL